MMIINHIEVPQEPPTMCTSGVGLSDPYVTYVQLCGKKCCAFPRQLKVPQERLLRTSGVSFSDLL